MASKFMEKKYSISSVIREMQIRTKIPSTIVRMTMYAAEDGDKEIHYTAGENVN